MAGWGQQRRLLVYRDLRRYGTVPHSGFGLAERLIAYVTGVQERPRCYSVPADAAQRDILNFSDINLKGQRKLAFLCQLPLKFNNLNIKTRKSQLCYALFRCIP